MDGIRAAELPADETAIRALWLEYLGWANDQLEINYGFRMPVDATVERDVAEIDKYRPPHGHLIVAVSDGVVVGVGCLRRIGPAVAEVKRMYVRPAHRGGGLGRALLGALLDAAEGDGWRVVRLDSAAFMTAAHRLYRSSGFREIAPYPESEIPERYRDHWVFMERRSTTDDGA
jgi:GNAT superfamily N-acetyltransferase